MCVNYTTSNTALPDTQAKGTCLVADLFLDREKMRVVDWPECEAVKLLEL